MHPLSALLVDDNPVFLSAAAAFLRELHPDEVAVVGTASGGEEALAQIRRLSPRVVLLDLCMSGVSGLEVIPRVREAYPEVRIIVLTMLDTDAYRKAALAAGADGFVSKTTLETDLLPAIRRAAGAGRVARVP